MSVDLTYYVIDKIYLVPGPKKKTPDSINFRCPFCGDSHKKYSKARGHFYVKTNSFHCFNCDKDSGAFELVAQIENKTVSQVKSEFFKSTKMTGAEIISQSLTSIKVEVVKETSVGLPDDCIPYSDDIRTRDLIEHRRIFDAPYLPTYAQFFYSPKAIRLIIPWYTGHNVSYWQSRALISGQEPKYLFPSNVTRPIYPLVQDNSFNYKFLHEGVFNAIWCKNSIVCGSVYLSKTQKELLEAYREGGTKLVYFFDNYNVDKSAKETIVDLAKADRNALFFKWDRSIKEKDLNDIAMNNPTMITNFSNPVYLQNHIVSAAKILLEIKLNGI